MSKRTTTKPAAEPVITKEQMRSAMEQYVEAQSQIDIITAKLAARMERRKAIAARRSQPWENQLKINEAILHAYALANPNEFKDPRKLVVYGGHSFGFQTGNPTVAMVRPVDGTKKQSVEGFIALAEKNAELEAAFLRKVSEMNKAAILDVARRAKPENEDEKDREEAQALMLALSAAGVIVKQDESFVIVLNLPAA